jgi:hypothetical protein
MAIAQIKRVLLFIVLSQLFSLVAYAQTLVIGDSTNLKEKMKAQTNKREIELLMMMQLWDVATLSRSGGAADDFRNDISIRRGRVGVKGKITKDVSFCVVAAYDGIGREKLTAGNGGPNAGDNRDFYLWDAILSWNINPMFNVIAGYFRPQIGRENITAAFKVISFEKSLANFQPRIHLLNRNTGRETGVNLGGLYLGKGWSFNYNVGYFDLTSEKIISNGKYWSPMLVSRVAFTLGDPEMDSYRINYSQSFYGKRNGITLGLNGCHTGKTEIFTDNGMYGVDLLANYKNWDLNVEYDWLYRNSILDSINNTFTMDDVYSARIGYNFLLKKEKIVQVSVMYSGQLANDYGSSERLNSLTGAADSKVFDIGVNYLLNKDNLKFNLHYVWGKNHQMKNDPNYSYVGFGFQFLL